MRKHLIGAGALAAGIMLVLGLAFVSGRGSAPSAHAQTPECPDNQDPVRCVTITKAVTGGGGDSQDFAFTFGGSAFSIGAGEQASFVLSDSGVNVVVEAELDGWTLSSIDCTDDVGVDATMDVSLRTLNIDVTAAADEDASVTCTFTNTAEATPTATASQSPTTTATTTPTATTTTTSGSSNTTPTATTAPANTPIVPTVTPFTPTPQPPASQVEGTISPPSTGDGGLK